MFQQFRVEVLIPGGRQRYLDLLLPSLLRAGEIDRIHLLLNTENPDDLTYMRGLNHPKIVLKELPEGVVANGIRTVGHIYKTAVDPSTIYIKIDDDVIWLQAHAIKALLEGRLRHADCFLVSPVVINNTHCSHMLQRHRKFDYVERYIVPGPGGFAKDDPAFAITLHRKFLDIVEAGREQDFFIADQMIAGTRFSINCICFFGKDMAKTNGEIAGIWPHMKRDDEEYLSVHLPAKLGKSNGVIGNALVAHFAFHNQEQAILETGILDRYRRHSETLLTRFQRVVKKSWAKTGNAKEGLP